MKSLPLQKPKKFNKVIATGFGVAVIGLGFVVVASRAASGTATLSLTPASAIESNGATFSVQIYEDSGNATTNAVQANLTYPTAGLTLTSIDSTNSAFPLEAQSTGGNGTISIARATNGGQAPLSGKQLVATLNFTSLMKTGSATVTWASGSAVVSSADNTALILTTQNATFAPDTTAPGVPTALHTTASTGSSISIAWTASTDNVAVTGYNVYRDGIKVATVQGTSYQDGGLAMGTSHNYQVTAIDAAGNESAKSVTLAAATPDTVAPSVPGGLNAQATAYNRVSLTWTASTDTGGSGLAGYRIYRNGSTTALASTATATYTDTTVQGSATYSYTVSAYDGAGNESGKSQASSVTTPAPPDTTPPSIPSGLTMTGSTLTTISLSWTASTDNVGVTGYQIARGGITVTTTPGTTFTDSSLTSGASYTYTIKAVDAAGNVSAPATLNASTLPLKVGDLNFDNAIDVLDLSILLSDWGSTGTVADLNHDSAVNIFDLSTMISNWGK